MEFKLGQRKKMDNFSLILRLFWEISICVSEKFSGIGSLCEGSLRLERGGGQWIFISCACFLITQSFLKIYRHAIHKIKAEYHSYLMVSMILYNSSEVKLKIAKEKEN